MTKSDSCSPTVLFIFLLCARVTWNRTVAHRLIPCPCVSYFNTLNYSCLRLENSVINGSLDKTCESIFAMIGTPRYEFKLLKLNPFDLTKSIHYNNTYGVGNNNSRWFVKRQYEIVTDSKTFSDALALHEKRKSQITMWLNCKLIYQMEEHFDEVDEFIYAGLEYTETNYIHSYRFTAVDLFTETIQIRLSPHPAFFAANQTLQKKTNDVFFARSYPKDLIKQGHLTLGSVIVGKTYRNLTTNPFTYTIRGECNIEPEFNPDVEMYWKHYIEPLHFEVLRPVITDFKLHQRSIRTYSRSAVSFSVQWDVPDYLRYLDCYAEILCVFYGKLDEVGHPFSLFKDCGEKDEECSNARSFLYGPTTAKRIPFTDRRATFNIKIGFENNIYENGTFVHVPTTEQAMINMFQFNYLPLLKEVATADHKHEYYWEWDSIYFSQSILIPLQDAIKPQALNSEILKDMKAVCAGRISEFENQEHLITDPLDINLAGSVIPLSFITFRVANEDLFDSNVKFDLLERIVPQNIFTIKRLFPDVEEAAITGCRRCSVISSTPFTPVQYLINRCFWHENCSYIISQDFIYYQSRTSQDQHLPAFYIRDAACYNWILRKWYIFVMDRKKKTYTLAASESDISNGSVVEDITWVPLDVASRRNYPVHLECPSLHSILLWTELDKKGNVYVYKMRIDPSTGGKAEEPEEMDQELLCSCTASISLSNVTIPVISIVYTDLDDSNSLAIAVVCGEAICSTSLLTEGSPVLIKQHAQVSDVSWFALSQTHVIYLLHSQNQTMVVESYGPKIPNQEIYYLNIDLVQSNRTRDLEEGFYYYDQIFWRVLFPNAEHHLPVPPRECIFPSITDVTFQPLHHGAGQLILEHSYDSSALCAMLLKPPVIYRLQYSVILGQSVSRNNASWLQCRTQTDNDEREINELNCRTVFTQSTAEKRTKYSFGNLRKDMDYFLIVSAELHLYDDTASFWFSGAKFSTLRKIFNTKFVPETESNPLPIILGTGIPLTIFTVAFIAIFLWYYNKRLYVYQYLTRLSAKDIHRESKIGEGNFGEVWKAKLRNETIVIKTLKESATDKEEKEFRDEALILSKFKNEHIVKTIGICLQSRPIMLGLEFLNGGSLDSYLRKYEVRAIIEAKDMLFIIRDALKGCIYLEEEGFLHRDISARNCLLEVEQNRKPKVVKISDFGLAKDIGTATSSYSSRNPSSDVLPVAWTPPEAFQGIFDRRSDVWAFGVLIWEVFTFAATPYGHCSLGGSHKCHLHISSHAEVEYNVCVLKKTLADSELPCSSSISPDLKEIMLLCWKYNIADRPSFKQLCIYLSAANHKILTEIVIPDFEMLESDRWCDHQLASHANNFTPAYETGSVNAQSVQMIPEYTDKLNTSQLRQKCNGAGSTDSIDEQQSIEMTQIQ